MGAQWHTSSVVPLSCVIWQLFATQVAQQGKCRQITHNFVSS